MPAECGTCGAILAPGTIACHQCGSTVVGAQPAPARNGGDWGGLDLATSRQAPGPPPPPAATSGGTLALGDDPLHSFGTHAGPALELDEEPQQKRKQARKKKERPKPTREEEQARRIGEIARYGPVPTSFGASVRYAVHVYLRKNTVQTELQAIEAQRDRALSQAKDALASLGEVLYGRHGDPQLAALADGLQRVAAAEANMGNRLAEGQSAKQRTRGQLAEVQSGVMAAQAQAEPLKRREAKLEGGLNAIRAQLRHLESQMKQLEVQMKKVRAAGDEAHHAKLQAEWDARHGESESLEARLGPYEEGLGEVRRELAKHMGMVAALHEEQRQITTRADVEQKRLRASAGDAKSEHRSALQELGRAAIVQGFAHYAPNMSQAAEVALATVDEKNALADLHRSAAESYDVPTYRKGMQILIGGLAAVSLALVVLIFRG